MLHLLRIAGVEGTWPLHRLPKEIVAIRSRCKLGSCTAVMPTYCSRWSWKHSCRVLHAPIIPHQCIPAASVLRGVDLCFLPSRPVRLTLLLAVPFTGANKPSSGCGKIESFSSAWQKSCPCDRIYPSPSLQHSFFSSIFFPCHSRSSYLSPLLCLAQET
jgi:hypothetical protein